jgi:predicted permease
VLSGSEQLIILQVPGYTSPNRLTPTAYFMAVSDSYFRTLGVPLLLGRDFTDGESRDAPDAVIVNEQFARVFFAGDALGKTFSYGGGTKTRVVGIAGTAKFGWVREDPHPVMYFPVTQQHFPKDLFLQVRTAGEPTAAIERLRALVRNLDSRVPIDGIATMRMQIDQAFARERLLAFLSTFLALVSVILAAIGIYGVLSFSVARRMREIGIRMAVGAERWQVVRLFMTESAWLVLAGVALGIPLALMSGRLASSLLYGLKPQDTATAILATSLLTLVALLATYIPARRASRIDPMEALRHE